MDFAGRLNSSSSSFLRRAVSSSLFVVSHDHHQSCLSCCCDRTSTFSQNTVPGFYLLTWILTCCESNWPGSCSWPGYCWNPWSCHDTSLGFWNLLEGWDPCQGKPRLFFVKENSVIVNPGLNLNSLQLFWSGKNTECFFFHRYLSWWCEGTYPDAPVSSFPTVITSFWSREIGLGDSRFLYKEIGYT